MMMVKKNTFVLIVLFFISALSFCLINQGYRRPTAEARDVTSPVPTQSGDEPVPGRDQNNIPINPVADGTAHEVTLYPPELGTLPWTVGEDSICDQSCPN